MTQIRDVCRFNHLAVDIRHIHKNTAKVRLTILMQRFSICQFVNNCVVHVHWQLIMELSLH